MGQPAREKGAGYFGALVRPDKRVSSEISIGVDFGQGEMEIPTLVPTLTPQEVQTLLSLPEGRPIPRPIVDKAVAFARQRLAAQLSPFAGAGEARTTLYPELPRGAMPPPDLGPVMGLGEFVRGYLGPARKGPVR